MPLLRTRALKERDFQRWVIDLARVLRWKVWHVPAPMVFDTTGARKGFVGSKDAAGLADLIMVRGRYLIFAEIKGTGGKLSEKQREFLATVNEMVCEHVLTFAWWPGDERQIEGVLARPEAFTPRKGP